MSTSDNTVSNPRDVYARVTDQIINAIEQGVSSNWRMPWHTSGRYAFSPINVTSRKPYRGINTVCLWAAAEAKGYECGEWGTYQQWHERKAQVRKGEKATSVVFWKFADDADESQEGADHPHCASRLLFARAYSVFNAAQVDGYTAKGKAEPSMLERIQHAEAFFSALGANLKHGGNRAYYSPDTDHIQMPPSAAFIENVRYYSTLAHEHMHWTTAKPERCDRQFGKRFGDTAYAAEELIGLS